MPFVPESVQVKERKAPLESFDTSELMRELDAVYKQIDEHLTPKTASPTCTSEVGQETPSRDEGLDLTEDEILRILHESHHSEEKVTSIYDSMFD